MVSANFSLKVLNPCLVEKCFASSLNDHTSNSTRSIPFALAASNAADINKVPTPCRLNFGATTVCWIYIVCNSLNAQFAGRLWN